MLRNRQIIRISCTLLILYIFLGFVFSQTTIATSSMGIVFYSIMMLFFLLTIMKNSFAIATTRFCKYFFISVPFLLYTFFGYFLAQEYAISVKWLICLIVLILAHVFDVDSFFLKKTIVGIGLFCLLGVFFQFFFTDFYNRYVVWIFINKWQIINFSRDYGFAGFTYQLDTTATPMIYAECVLIFSQDFFRNKRIYITNSLRIDIRDILIVLLIIGTFMTGKRLHSLVSIIIPVFVLFLSIKNKLKAVLIASLISIFILIGFAYFAYYAGKLADSLLLGRIAQAFLDFRAGGDISSGRSYLAELAISLWKSSPIFGVGVSNYTELSGAYTDVHNTYLQVLCEQGVVGLILFIVPIVYCFFGTLIILNKTDADKKKANLKISLAVQLFYIFYSFTGNTNINMFGFMMYYLSIGVLISSSMNTDYSQNGTNTKENYRN